MPRAGFTAISSGTIRFGRDGRWYSDDEPIANRAICRLFSRALRVLPDGRGRLELGEDRADVVIEDTPWVVVRVEGYRSVVDRVRDEHLRAEVSLRDAQPGRFVARILPGNIVVPRGIRVVEVTPSQVRAMLARSPARS